MKSLHRGGARSAWWAAVVMGMACSSPGDGGGAAGARSIFVVPSSLDALSGPAFFDHPWPSDLRREASGAIVVKGVYDPYQAPLIQQYVQAVSGKIDGFSVAAFGYLRFGADLDPATLPASPPDTLDAKATVQIVDVDPASPEHGQRHLAQTFWRKDDGVYWVKDTLAVGPAMGYPLRAKTRYATVVTRGVKAVGGASIAPSDDLAEVLGVQPPTARTQAAHDLYAPAVAELAALGVRAADIAHLAVFTTNDPTAELFAIADDVKARTPAPAADAAKWQPREQTAAYDVYEGSYGPSPNYQAGAAPYTATGGGFVFDAAGHAVVQNDFDLRFTLVVPAAASCPMPASGYPIVIYAHGTGGDYRSIVDESHGVGDAVARLCMASIGTDQIFHGARPGAPPASDPNREGDEELAFFNFGNPDAIRTNTRQSALDVVQEARLFTETKMTVPAGVARGGKAIAFDPSHVVFFGHSQGGLNGPLYLAADSSARGGVLSGASSSVPITLLEKTKPSPSVAGAWKVLLQLTSVDDSAELNIFHPMMSFTQTIVDPIDPLAYMGYLVRHPRAGFAPKSIFQTEGVSADGTGDSYAPPHGIEVGAAAIGLPRQAPGVHALTEAPWGPLADVTIPGGGLQGNLAGGAASGVLAQFVPATGSDGHFVFFDIPAARTQAAQFCRNLADDPKGRVPAP